MCPPGLGSVAAFGSWTSSIGMFPNRSLVLYLRLSWASELAEAASWFYAILGSATNIDVSVGRTVVGIQVARRAIVVVRIATEDNMPTGQPVPVHLP